jgi:Xaa-Pro dipeptidase
MSGGPIFIEYDLIPKSEYEQREKNIRKLMERERLDLLMIYGDEYRYGDSVYVANYKGLNIVEEAPYCIFFPLEGDSVLFTGRFNMQPAKRNARIKDVRCVWDIEEHLKDISKGKKFKRVGFTSQDIIPFSIYEGIRKGLAGAELIPASDLLAELRARKSDNEVRLLRKAGQIADMALKVAREALKPGMTLWQLLAIAEDTMRKSGGDNPFANMVGSGEELSDRVYLASDKVIKEGELLVIGLHPNYRWYCNDTERVWRVGKVPQDQENAVLTAGKIMREMEQYVRPGLTWKDLLEHEKELIKREGYYDFWGQYAEETRGHALGHGIGLDMVEWPRRYPRDWDFVLQPNTVFAFKCEFHGFKWGGLRHESVMLVTKTGGEALNKAPYD